MEMTAGTDAAEHWGKGRRDVGGGSVLEWEGECVEPSSEGALHQEWG